MIQLEGGRRVRRRYTPMERAQSQLKSAYRALNDLGRRAIPYVGLPANGNVGDEELCRIARRHLGVREFALDCSTRGRFLSLSVRAGRGYYLFGGGSLIFARDLLPLCEALQRAGARPLLLGTGSTDPPSDSRERERWAAVLGQAQLAGVRGPVTARALADIGVSAQVVGDLGYLVNLDLTAVVSPADYVVISARSIRASNPELHQQDYRTRALLQELILSLHCQGHTVVVLSASSDDHEVVRGWARELPESVQFLAYDGRFAALQELLSRAQALITMRMHPGVFAAAWGVPVVILDRRAKYVDALAPIEGEVTLHDPAGMTSDLLTAAAQTALNEPPEQRVARFRRIRELALTQREYCESIQRFLKA
jgi:polysaccharide pyruvyl transferase WcaK-like protein